MQMHMYMQFLFMHVLLHFVCLYVTSTFINCHCTCCVFLIVINEEQNILHEVNCKVNNSSQDQQQKYIKIVPFAFLGAMVSLWMVVGALLQLVVAGQAHQTKLVQPILVAASFLPYCRNTHPQNDLKIIIKNTVHNMPVNISAYPFI